MEAMRTLLGVCVVAGLLAVGGVRGQGRNVGTLERWNVRTLGQTEAKADPSPPSQNAGRVRDDNGLAKAGVPEGTPAVQSVPRVIRFSGVLKDRAGRAKSGVVGVTFAIYAEQEDGVPLWMETQNVAMEEGGKYTVLLGAVEQEGFLAALEMTDGGIKADPSPPSQNAGRVRDDSGAGSARWLGVEGPDIQEMPRVLLVSVPYALKAADAETLGGLPVSAFVRKEDVETSERQNVGTSGVNDWGGVEKADPSPPSQNTGRVRDDSAAGRAGAGTSTAPVLRPATTGSTAPGLSPASTISTTATTTVKAKAAGATTASTANDVVKYDSNGSLVASAITESSGNVGIGTTNPLSALHVIGDTVRVNSPTTAQVQVSGVASSGRFGQDANGAFLANDTSGSALRFLTSNNSLNEWMRIGSTGSVNIGSAQASQFGEAVFAPDNVDRVHSVIGQAGSQYHFRLSRATPDIRGARDFLITPYTYGTAIEYPGVMEFWTQEFSVHGHPSRPGLGAYFWVGDEIDSGGLVITARDNGGGANSFVTLAANRFDFTSHGSMNFVVRDPVDTFRFAVGAVGSELVKGRVSGTATASSLDLFSGTVQATLRAQSGSSTGGTGGGVQFGSTSNDTFSLFTNNGAAQVTLFPSGNFSIGNATDAAPLAVGTTAQFQVSAAGAATIGGGTAITRHLSVSAQLAFAQFVQGSCNTLSVAVSGASDGDSVALGIPSALGSIGGLTWFGWVSAPDTVSVRGCNATNQTLPTPPAANVRVDVWQH